MYVCLCNALTDRQVKQGRVRRHQQAPCWPRSFARIRPSVVRSTISSRSNSAKPPRMLTTRRQTFASSRARGLQHSRA